MNLRELYQEVILDHKRNPRNVGAIDPCTHHAEGHNPLCGDQLKVYIDIQNDIINNISFEGQGCAISTASASLMTEAVKLKSLQDAHQMFDELHDTLTGDSEPNMDSLGKLAVLAGVREYPMRVKCATLAWHTLQAAINQTDKAITTE